MLFSDHHDRQRTTNKDRGNDVDGNVLHGRFPMENPFKKKGAQEGTELRHYTGRYVNRE